MLTFLAPIGFSLAAAQSPSFNDQCSSDELINPWPIIATACLGAATLALYSALSAKRVTKEDTNKKLKEIISRSDSRKQHFEISKNPSGCRCLIDLMNCFKTKTHPKSTPCRLIEAVQGTHSVPIFNTNDDPLE